MEDTPTAWQRLIGPDSTPAESRGAIVGGLVGAAVAVLLAAARTDDVTPVGIVILGLMAADVVGGVWANATSSTRRWYHRPGAGFWSGKGFALLHVHPFVVAWVVPGFGWVPATALYVGMLVAYIAADRAPAGLAAPVASMGALTVFTVVLATDPGMAGVEWFVPAYLLKLLVGHAVPAVDRRG